MSAYLRYPHIHGDLVRFVADDDVWLVPITGGRAWRLTTHRAPAAQPRFAPDRRHVAYVSHRDGHPEVFVVDVERGDARRLTWWGAYRTLVLGWTADGRVLAATHAGEANLRHLVVKAVALDGTVERLDLGPASGVAITGDGTVALSTPGSRPPAALPGRHRVPAVAAQERQLGAVSRGRARRPGRPDVAGGQARLRLRPRRPLPRPRRRAGQPLAVGHPGSGEPRQLTHQGPAEGYVRDAMADGHRIVWHSKGRLWLLEDLDVLSHQVGDTRLIGVRPPSALWRRSVL